jgi:hypothetical protein
MYQNFSLRAAILGHNTLDFTSDQPDHERAPRQRVTYECPRGHDFQRTFAAEANPVPDTWTCPRHGAEGHRPGASKPNPGKPPRTPWDMLIERRSIADLEQLLNQRLAALRAERHAARKTDPAPGHA